LVRKSLFNNEWKFTKQEIGTAIETLKGEDVKWTEVDLPHDWLIYNTKDLYETGEGWYKKNFTVDEISGKVINICFEGVYMNSTVYVNGETAGEWKYGYSSFEFDITRFLKVGENEIVVRVVHQAPNSRWYSGAGIYRNVWLKTTALVHLVTDGIYITTEKKADGWHAVLETEAISKATDNAPVDAVIQHVIIDKVGREAAVAQNQMKIQKDVTLDKQTVFVERPQIWSLDHPYLYTLKTQILVDGAVTDEVSQKFGFRTIRFDSEEGFFLNEVHVKLYGANEHHDLGSLGAAMNKTALRRQLMMLKQMGVNAIRTSHNMPAVEMMELADEMGILIVSEAFDMWERHKTEHDYAAFFNEWCEKDVASWIRRDRNHPSIIMWSIGNEIYDTHVSERGLEITKMLKSHVLLHDPKKNGQVTIGSNYMIGENAQKCADEVQAAGYNYAERLYAEHHEKYPHWYIFGSETASTLQSRGIYHFPANKTVVMYEDEQCSSLDNCTTSWGAKSIQYNITEDRDAEFSLGQFIWTGFDYIGEPTPYTTKNSYYGQIDTAGFPKDSFYLYQAEWTDYKTNPMVHILPYWDFNEGQLIDVLVYSNAPKIEFFFNEKSKGSFEIDHEHGKELIGKWQLPYQRGTIKAVAYDENGNIIATDSQSSFSDAVKIVLKSDKKEFMADGQDLIFMEISMADTNGIPVANANNRVEVEVSGAGRLIGLDNGDSTDYDQYKGTSRKLFSGKLLAIIAAKTTPGEVHVKVSSIGLPTEELTLRTLKSDITPGVSACMENVKSEPKDEVPIRKIELTNHGTNKLNGAAPTTTVTAKLLPEHTTYQEVEWKAVTAAGIQTNIAKIEVEGSTATITALGDGEFRLRCTAKNGRDTVQVISELEFEITGLGAATVSPYQMIDAALYNVSNYEIDNGLMGGINTRDGVINLIGYKGLDFGDYGSDEVTLPICYWGNDPIPLEIWEGIPGETDAVQLLNTHYQADWIWATFLPNTFRLPKRLKGITTVCFVLYDKANVKGFEFTYTEKAYEKLSAKDNNQIYGDSFTVTEDAIEHIGNNVSLEFDHMDFGPEGFTKLIICGKANTDNTIHIHFNSEEGSVRQIAEFSYTEEYSEMEFLLDKVTGKQKVSFVFLPGCDFDFKWFRFIK
jgi:beta-galactosidase